MTHTRFAPIPHHIYGFVDETFISDGTGWEPCAWFGLHAHAGRAFTISVHLKSGAVYRHLPLHAFAFEPTPEPWKLEQAQLWDCFGDEFSVGEFDYLQSLLAKAYIGGKWIEAEYLFTLEFIGDGWSEAPDQTKASHFLRVGNRLSVQAGNRILFKDPSFNGPEWNKPSLKLASRWWEAERERVFDSIITEESA